MHLLHPRNPPVTIAAIGVVEVTPPLLRTHRYLASIARGVANDADANRPVSGAGPPNPAGARQQRPGHLVPADAAAHGGVLRRGPIRGDHRSTRHIPDAIDLDVERNVLTVKTERRPSAVGEHVEFQVAERPSSRHTSRSRGPARDPDPGANRTEPRAIRIGQVQSQSPEEPGVPGAVAVLGQIRALHRLAGPGALDRAGVDHPHVVGPHRGVAGQDPDPASRSWRPGDAAACCSRAAWADTGTDGAGGRGYNATNAPRWCARAGPTSRPV
ncbi:MAG: hypothetical protein V7646_5008 [Pseudonocardia sp.]